ARFRSWTRKATDIAAASPGPGGAALSDRRLLRSPRSRGLLVRHRVVLRREHRGATRDAGLQRSGDARGAARSRGPGADHTPRDRARTAARAHRSLFSTLVRRRVSALRSRSLRRPLSLASLG